MMTDPIADMLTRIRNASLVYKKEVVLPLSKIKIAIANILVREGYLNKTERYGDSVKPQMIVELKYNGRTPALSSLKRISKPGHRRYVKNNELFKVLNGYGISIISTPRGIMTGKEAKKANLGGELICEIY